MAEKAEKSPHHQSRHPMSRRQACERQEPIFKLLSDLATGIYQESEPVVGELIARVEREAKHADARMNHGRARLLRNMGGVVRDWHDHVTWQNQPPSHEASEETASEPAAPPERRVRWPQAMEER